MTRQEIVEHWEMMIPTVFVAEDAIRDKWQKRLSAAKSMTPVQREELSKQYVHAVAVEIVSRISDEELQMLK